MIRLTLQTIVSAALAAALVLVIAEATKPSRDKYELLTCDVLFDEWNIVWMECPAESENARVMDGTVERRLT